MHHAALHVVQQARHLLGHCLAAQVQADVRTIISKDFATRHSLRFPRVERIRYDKSPFDVQTDQELWDLVNQNKGVVTGMQQATLGLCLPMLQPHIAVFHNVNIPYLLVAAMKSKSGCNMLLTATYRLLVQVHQQLHMLNDSINQIISET